MKKTELHKVMMQNPPKNMQQRMPSQERLVDFPSDQIIPQENRSKISNNPLAMVVPQTDTRKREVVKAANLPRDPTSVERQQYFLESRDAYKTIKYKNGNTGVAYNILTGI